MQNQKMFRILFRRGVQVKGSPRLKNYGRMPYSLLVEELSEHRIRDVTNVFHDDSNPSNRKQFTGAEMLKLWQDVQEHGQHSAAPK